MCECWLCQGKWWCPAQGVKLGEVCSDDVCGVSVGVSEAACAPQPCSPGLASCSLELWFWLSSKSPGESLQWEPLFTTAQSFSHLWVRFICFWPHQVLGQSSERVKLLAQFIYLSSDTRPCKSGALSGRQSFLNRVTIDRSLGIFPGKFLGENK